MKKEYSLNLKSIIGNPNHPRSGHFGVYYRGVNYVKCPFDYVIYQMLLEEVKPDLVIEIGTFNGGGALYISDIISRWGGVVHTIDIENKELDPLIEKNSNIFTFNDGYQGYDINLSKKFSKILVIDDGSHYYHDVKSSFEKFNGVVSLGSYFIVEDGAIYFESPDSHDGGPIKAIEEILKETQDFEIDRHWCDFFGTNATFNTDGYLKKTGETKKP
jgi:cephalosporin hydroxylase